MDRFTMWERVHGVFSDWEAVMNHPQWICASSIFHVALSSNGLLVMYSYALDLLQSFTSSRMRHSVYVWFVVFFVVCLRWGVWNWAGCRFFRHQAFSNNLFLNQWIADVLRNLTSSFAKPNALPILWSRGGFTKSFSTWFDLSQHDWRLELGAEYPLDTFRPVIMNWWRVE